MNVLSPKDGFEISLNVKDGDHVTAGTKVLELDTVSEDLRIARLNALESLRAILEQRLSQQAIDTSNQLCQVPIDRANAVLPKLQDILDQVIAGQTLGSQPPGTSDAVQAALISVTGQRDKVVMQQQLSTVSLQISQKLNNITKDHLQVELTAAARMKDTTTIIATMTGNLHLKVLTGSFVRRGQVLFEVR